MRGGAIKFKENYRMQQPLKPTSAHSRHTAIRSSGENPLSSTGFSFHANDVLNPSIFERGQLVSPKQPAPGINVFAESRPRPMAQTQGAGGEGFSKLFHNQKVREYPRKNISARVVRRFPFQVPISPQNIDASVFEAPVIIEKRERKVKPSPKRKNSIPHESQFFGLKDNRQHLINNSNLLGELKDVVHKKRENKVKSMDMAIASNKLSQTATPSRVQRLNLESPDGSISPRTAILEDLNFEIRAWKKVNPKRTFGPRAILLGKEEECMMKKEIGPDRGASPVSRVPLPQIIRKVANQTPHRHHSMGIEGGESIFSVTTDGRVSVLQAVGYHTAEDDQVSVMAQVLKASIADQEKREDIAREIIGENRGSVDKDVMETAGELHFWLMEKMSRLKDLRMELGLNFDLIKAINGQQREDYETLMSRGSPHKGLQEAPISLNGLKIMLNEKIQHFLQMNATELNQHLRNSMNAELTELCKVFRMAMRTIYTSPLSHIQPALFVMEHAWKLTLYLFEAVYGNQDYLIQTGTEDIQREIEIERQELNAKVDEVSNKMQLKLDEASETIKQLKLTVERLTHDKEHAIALIQDRDLEIKRLRSKREGQPHQLTNFLNELESNLNQAIEERKLQLDAMGFMADICTVQEGTGKLSPIWEKKRNKMKQDALAVVERTSYKRGDTPSIGAQSPRAPTVKESFNFRKSPNFLVPQPTDQVDSMSVGLTERVASYMNPYIKKAREGIDLEDDPENTGINVLIEELFNKLLDDEEEDIFKELIDLNRLEFETRDRPGTAESNAFSASDRSYKLLQIQQKFTAFKKLTHEIWQHVKFHENELRKALTHEDDELALLLNPVDKTAGVEESTQTALRLNPLVKVDYSPFSQAMHLKSRNINRQAHNPLLIILNTYRHKRTAQYGQGRQTLMPGDLWSPMEQGILVAFLFQAMEEKVKNEDRSRKTEELLDFSHFFYDYLVIQFGLKTQAISNFQFIYRNLKYMYKIKEAKMAMQALNLMGIGEFSFSQDQEILFIKSVLVFKDMWFANQKPGKTSSQNATEESLHQAAVNITNIMQIEPGQSLKMLQLFEKGELNVQEVVEKLKRLGISTQGDALAKQMGTAVLENIYSDPPSYLKKIDTPRSPKRDIEEDSKSNDTFNGNEETEEHQLNAALAKLELAEEKQRKPHKRVFEIIDKEKKGTITKEQFQTYTRDVLQVHWTAEQVELVNKYFDPGNLDLIDRDQFVGKLAEKKDILKAYYNISLYGFTKGLMKAWTEFKQIQKHSLLEMFEKYDENKDHVLSLQEFETMLRSIEPNMKTADIVRLYRETLDMEASTQDIDKMSPEAFCQMAFQYKLGGHGKELFQDYQ